MPRLALLALALSIWLTGCVPRRTYQVMVHNDSHMPVTVWLTKNGPPFEASWAAPEHVALQRPGDEEPLGGVIIPAGRTGETGRVRGQFPAGVEAILRVYAGERTMSELLAMGSRSPDRTDLVLRPGRNEVLVRRRDAGISVELVPHDADRDRR